MIDVEKSWRTEFSVCKNKVVNEWQKKQNFFSQNKYFIEFKRGFCTQTHSSFVDLPIVVSFGNWHFSLDHKKREMIGGEGTNEESFSITIALSYCPQ